VAQVLERPRLAAGPLPRRDLIETKGGVYDEAALIGHYQLIDDVLVNCYTLSGCLLLGKYLVPISGASTHEQ